MKRRIAVFGSAWGDEYFRMILNGIKAYASEHKVDVDVFVNYSMESFSEEDKHGEQMLFSLFDAKQYEGAIILANSINVKAEKELLQKKLDDNRIPTICLEYELNGMGYIGSENYSGMYELAEHLFRDHGYREILYIGGPKDHNEAKERLKAVFDAARKYNIILNDENICYGDWSYFTGADFVDGYLKKNNHMPDAIICANDIMALGICEVLPFMGYTPGIDVAVTGFDALKQGSGKNMTLTSVARNWNVMGAKAMEVLLEQEWNFDKPKRIVMDSVLVKGDSCGCKHDVVLPKEQITQDNRYETKFIGSVELDIHLRIIYDLLHNSYTLEDVHNNLSPFIVNDGHFYETEEFALCLNPQFFMVEDEINETQKSYDNIDYFVAVSTVLNKKIYDMEKITTKDLAPKALRNCEESNVLLFAPLHLDQHFIGYAIMRAYEAQFHKSALFVWTKHMTQYLQQIRQNIQIRALTERLTMLSNTDGLTGLYNRTGCNNIILPFYNDCMSQGKSVAFLMCDVDDMKEINDKFGHLQGDLAICTLANAIKENMNDVWYACRYGGDEFLVVGMCESEQQMQEILECIEKNMEKQIEQTKAPFNLRVSIGGSMIHAIDTLSFEMAIKLADDRMYKKKREHKKESGGVIR